MAPRRIDAVLIDAANAERLVTFYRDLIGLPLKIEQHGETEPHWGCFVDGIHFAIHKKEEPTTPVQSTYSISFQVDDVDQTIRDLKTHAIEIELEPQDRDFGRLAAVRDPNGNLVYFHKYLDNVE